MSSLPSFVDLMESLGLEEQAKHAPTEDHFPLSQPSSPAAGSKNARTRPSSSPSLREVATSHHISRYSPYSSAVSPTLQRGLSPDSSSSDFECSPLSPVFSPSRSRPRKTRNRRPHVHCYGSSSDLAADTPISTYVRRKTPGTSPTSPTFNRDSGYESGSSSSPTAMPFSIPCLPVLLPNSPTSQASNTSTSDSELEDVVPTSLKSGVKRIFKSRGNRKFLIVRRPTGVRISVPPYSTNFGERFMDP